MRLPFRATAAFTILNIAMLCGLRLQAQEDLDEYSKLNTNVGMSWSAPLGATSDFVNYGWGVMTIGAGYNFNERHAFVGEFMWNSLYPTNAALAPFRIALKSHDVNAHGNLFTATMNYRYELRGHKVGTYFIGGGGLYVRTAHVTKEVITGTTTTCTRVWVWWGFTCENGFVSSDQTLASSTSSAFGANAGIGFTAKVGEPRYRMYIEARYHYAPTKPINTRLIPITIGIRF